MASLKTHKRKGGKPDSYSIEWRLGGGRDGKWQYETFDPLEGAHRDHKHAKAFRATVEAAGHQWPANYLPGLGFTDPETYRAALEGARAEDEAAANPAVLLRDYAAAWVERRAKDPSFGQVRKDRQYLRDYIIPKFGDRDLRDPSSIKKREIEDWALDLWAGEQAEDVTGEQPDAETDEFEDDLATQTDQVGVEWVRRPLSPKTIANVIRGTLSALLTFAVEDEELPKRMANPCSRAKLPKPKDDDEGREEMVFLSPEQLGILLGAMNEDARDLTMFLFGTGLRFSEATALRVRDFLNLDPDFPTFRVRWAWKQAASDGAWYIGKPKTPSSRRQLALTRSQVEMIRRLIEGRGPEEFVFTGPQGGRMTHSTYYSQRWRLAVYRAMRCPECRARDWEAGIGRRGGRELTVEHAAWCGHPGTLSERPRPHDLRHSHVAVLIFKNTHIKKIQQRLGHASIQITMDRYGHLFPEMDEKLVADLEEMLDRVG